MHMTRVALALCGRNPGRWGRQDCRRAAFSRRRIRTRLNQPGTPKINVHSTSKTPQFPANHRKRKRYPIHAKHAKTGISNTSCFYIVRRRTEMIPKPNAPATPEGLELYRRSEERRVGKECRSR